MIQAGRECQYKKISTLPFRNYLNHTDFEDPPERPYICAHNVIKSHARAYRIYDQEFRPGQNGQMGITLHYDWAEPLNRSDPFHVEAMHRSMHFKVRRDI